MAPTRAGVDRTISRHGRLTVIPRMMKVASAVRVKPVEYGPVVAVGPENCSSASSGQEDALMPMP